jgi:hypothetical protein
MKRRNNARITNYLCDQYNGLRRVKDVLCCDMTNSSMLFSRLFIVAVLGTFASAVAAEPSGCKECDRQKEESSHREQIKADRAKYDRENEKVTARPWDISRDDKLLPDKK